MHVIVRARSNDHGYSCCNEFCIIIIVLFLSPFLLLLKFNFFISFFLSAAFNLKPVFQGDDDAENDIYFVLTN